MDQQPKYKNQKHKLLEENRGVNPCSSRMDSHVTPEARITNEKQINYTSSN
jgi:hypothetical protein